MILKDSYFRIIDSSLDDGRVMCVVELDPAHPVYQGHFPGQPICPGICSMLMVRECLSVMLTRSLELRAVKECRLPAMLLPNPGRRVVVDIKYVADESGVLTIDADIHDDDATYLTLRATMA